MLQVEEVTKVYERPPGWLRPFVRTAVSEPVRALDAVSLALAAGEIVGLVGPNGAGKTTLIKVLSSLLVPTRGRVVMDGIDITRHGEHLRERLGLVLEGDQGLYGRLSGRQNLELYGRLAGLTLDVARGRATELLGRFDLAQRDKLVFGYSAGMKARLSICRALMADPPLLILDEPTRSLDPVASRFAMTTLRHLADDGRAILLSNHRLEEVVAVCTRVIAIVGGRVRFAGTPADLATSPGEASRELSDLLEREAARTT
jgi:ABC-2 type transport system ATP-binding protein